ncbi:MAG: TolC family protein [Acidobacteria bacterium]|nr:TolC family protein [Acidobacteriota bacterium]
MIHILLALVLQTVPAESALRLEDLEKMAVAKNPVLVQAAANVRAAEARMRQSGLYPNPIVGVSNDDLSYGPVIRGGEWGVFVEQKIVLGRKLGLNRGAAQQEIVKTQAQAEAQRLRVMNTVRTLFYQAMAAQRKVEVRDRLLTLVRDAVTTSKQLQNVGQADLPDVLEIEIEEQQAELALLSARNELQQVWTQLAAAVGDLSLRPARLEGDIDQIPALDYQETLALLLRESPEVKGAVADVSRAEFALRRARAEPIPNLTVRAGVHYNRELLEANGRPIGTQGELEIGIQLPLFNRNQGNVEAARADLERAQREIDRVGLSLRSRLAAAFRQYQDLRTIVERYREQMLPRARRAYDLYLAGFRQMAAAYPQALIAQRTLLQLQEEYDRSLASVWAKVVEIQGLLVEGGMDQQDLRSLGFEVENEERN